MRKPIGRFTRKRKAGASYYIEFDLTIKKVKSIKINSIKKQAPHKDEFGDMVAPFRVDCDIICEVDVDKAQSYNNSLYEEEGSDIVDTEIRIGGLKGEAPVNKKDEDGDDNPAYWEVNEKTVTELLKNLEGVTISPTWHGGWTGTFRGDIGDFELDEYLYPSEYNPEVGWIDGEGGIMYLTDISFADKQFAEEVEYYCSGAFEADQYEESEDLD